MFGGWTECQFSNLKRENVVLKLFDAGRGGWLYYVTTYHYPVSMYWFPHVHAILLESVFQRFMGVMLSTTLVSLPEDPDHFHSSMKRFQNEVTAPLVTLPRTAFILFLSPPFASNKLETRQDECS